MSVFIDPMKSLYVTGVELAVLNHRFQNRLISESAVHAPMHHRHRRVSDRRDHRALHSGAHLIGLRDTRPLRVETASDVNFDHRRGCRLLDGAWP